MDAKDITINISSRTIIMIILFGLLLAALYFLRDLVLVLLTAVVIASAIEPPVRFFMRFKIPRVFAVLIVYLTAITTFLAVFYFFVPPFLDEMAGFLSNFGQYADTANLKSPFGGGFLFSSGAADFSLSNIILEFRGALTSASESFFATLSAIFGGVLSFVLIIVLSFYFGVQENGIADFLRVVTPVQHQKYVVDLWRRSQRKIALWMQGQLILALIVGVLVYLGLVILDVRFAFFLALIAAMFELIPIFGPILAAIPAVAIAFTDGGTTSLLLVIGLFVIIQQFENHLIYPLVVKKVVGVPPLLVILAFIIGAKLAGFLGIILSVPVAAALQELVNDIKRKKALIAEKQTAK